MNNMTYRDMVRKHSIGNVLKLWIVLLSGGLALKIVQQEVIKHWEGKCCFYLLQTRREEASMEKLFVSGSSIGAYAEQHLHIKDTRLVNHCDKWVSWCWCAHPMRSPLPKVIRVKECVSNSKRVPSWNGWGMPLSPRWRLRSGCSLCREALLGCANSLLPSEYNSNVRYCNASYIHCKRTWFAIMFKT